MDAIRNSADKQDRPSIYRDQLKDLEKLRQVYQQTAMASGDWHVQTVKTVSASQRLTEAIQKQKITWKEARQEFTKYHKGQQGALSEAIKEQASLRGAMAAQMTGQVFGKNNTDMFLPRNLGSELDNVRLRYGMINQMIAAAAHNTINWGKNTQWAGRQITVGLTMPLGMAAVGAAALAKQVDTQLTEIAKVYDTTATTAAGKEQELARVRENALASSTRMAQQYGKTMVDTLEVQAKLAATGLNGNKLNQATDSAVRIAALGNMDTGKSTDMMVALTTAFGDQLDTTDKLNRALNFFNATENATSLGIEDIADAVPRAASAMAALGVSTDQMTVMLVAMREAGVDAAEAANALKSGTSSILKPTEQATKVFAELTNGLDINDLVEESKGNMYEFMKLFSEALTGLDDLSKQKAINAIFGKYQFNRMSALVNNFGDAMSGSANQTKKAMDLMALSSEELAATADTELERLQNSVAFKFTAAIESVKAALVPLGEMVLKFVTPVISGIGKLIGGFNDLSGPVKGVTLLLVGGIALAGPFLMLAGIMANLFGNIVKGGTAFSNLFIRFKALNAEQAANIIMAKNANSMFNSEAQSTAILAQNIRNLTIAMEENAVAAGLMMGKNGQMMAAGANGAKYSRQVVKNDAGEHVYAVGSLDANGNDISRTKASKEDATAFAKMQGASEKIEESSKRTANQWKGIGRMMGTIASVAAVAFPMMLMQSEGAHDSWINTALVIASIGFMVPGLWGGMLKGAKGVLANIKTWPAIIKSAFSGGNLRLAGSVMKDAVNQRGIRGIADGLGALAPRFTAIAGTALRIFGPVGILAGGAIYIKHIVDEIQAAESAAKALASSGKAWADAVGYTFNPGQMPGMEENANTATKSIKMANEMAEANKDLARAFTEAGSESKAYGLAMSQALHAITAGASPEQAREVMEASLNMAFTDPAVVKRLMIQFDEVDLSNPDAVRAAVAKQISGLFEGYTEGIDIRPLDDTGDSVADTIKSWFREKAGGDLSDEAREFGVRLGSTLGDAVNAAGDNVHLRKDAFDQATDEAEQLFQGKFNDLADNADIKKAFDKMGIKGADALHEAMARIAKKVKDGKELTEAEKALRKVIMNADYSDMFSDFDSEYDEFLDTFVDGMLQAGVITESQAKKMRGAIDSVAGAAKKMGADNKGVISATEAQKMYNNAISGMGYSYQQMSEKQKLAVLNNYRAKAGLDAATTSAQGFGTEAEAAAVAAENLGNAMADMVLDGDQLTNGLKGAMSGTMDDLYDQASKIMDKQHEAEVKGATDSMNARMDWYDDQLDLQDESFDNQEKSLDKHWDQVLKSSDKAFDRQTKDAEAYWDGQEKAVEDARDASDKYYEDRLKQLDNEQKAYEKSADAQIKTIESQKDAWDEELDARRNAIQETIDAEQEAEDNRQKIFEAEQRRIERMAERLNTNIDFNVALNSGDLDQAAKISNDVSARESSWALEDRDRDLSEASAARVKTLQQKIDELETENDARQKLADAEIERINTEKDVREEAHQAEAERLKEEQDQRKLVYDAQLEQIKSARDVALEALKERQQAEREALEEQKTLDQERLRSARETARQNLENTRENERKILEAGIQRINDENAADKEGLAQRLRELQAFTPRNEQELRDHIAKVEQAYTEYGVQLNAQGNDWTGKIAGALQTNVAVAAAALQNEVNWKAIAENIAGQVGEGLGMSFDQVKTFLMTGTMPAAPPAPGAWSPAGGGKRADNGYKVRAQHIGGLSGVGFSQKDRTGVPRSASPYPSEIPTIIKQGEFVVNQKATRNHLPLLNAINNGDSGMPTASRHQGGPIAARHLGGLMEAVMGGVAMNLASSLMAAKVAAIGKYQEAKAAQDAAMAGGSTGTIEGGNTVWGRLWNTVKKAWPDARLNDSTRPGANDYHGRGMAVDLGWNKAPGGQGNAYMANMNRWIYDNFRGSTELIYNGLGDDRPNLKNGRDYAYSAAIQAGHRNHVHWAMTPEAIAAAGIPQAGGGNVGNLGGVKGIVQAEAAKRGWGSGPQWSALDWLVQHESSWNPNAQNPTSTAYGLFQFLNSTWAANKVAKSSDPRIQAIGGMNYIAGRYGNPIGAKAFWEKNHWYDQGGWMMPGESGQNGTKRPEPVFTGAQWDILRANITGARFDMPGRATATPMPVRVTNDGVATGTNNTYNVDVTFNGPVASDIDIKKAVWEAIDEKESRAGRRRVIN